MKSGCFDGLTSVDKAGLRYSSNVRNAFGSPVYGNINPLAKAVLSQPEQQREVFTLDTTMPQTYKEKQVRWTLNKVLLVAKHSGQCLHPLVTDELDSSELCGQTREGKQVSIRVSENFQQAVAAENNELHHGGLAYNFTRGDAVCVWCWVHVARRSVTSVAPLHIHGAQLGELTPPSCPPHTTAWPDYRRGWPGRRRCGLHAV